eukprot:SAG31_NODE_47890_length_209_cov_52.109091_1_plen_25_part_10
MIERLLDCMSSMRSATEDEVELDR